MKVLARLVPIAALAILAIAVLACAAPGAVPPAAPPAQATSAPAAATSAPAAATSAPAAATSAPAAGATPTQNAAEIKPPSTGENVINFYSNDDSNIRDWLENKIVPAFVKKFPQYQVNIISVRGVGNDTRDIADRAKAALDTNADPLADILVLDCLTVPALQQADLWVKIDETNVPNAKNLIKSIKTSDCSQPYRGSQVLIAYDSTKVPENEVPHTFPDLLTWIKAHPGQFVYCRPDRGGSGSNFVVRAIYEATGKDPSLFKPGEPDPALVAKFDDAWKLLRDIHPDIYDNGAYPAGNTQVQTLLANGSVSMASVWSDQSLQALQKGVYAPTIKLVQLTDLPFPGGYNYLSVPKNSRNVKGALEFINFLLEPDNQVSVIKELGGFPAVDWSLLPQELQSQFTSVIANQVPNWPGGKWGNVLNKGWYDNVATNIKQGSP